METQDGVAYPPTNGGTSGGSSNDEYHSGWSAVPRGDPYAEGTGGSYGTEERHSMMTPEDILQSDNLMLRLVRLVIALSIFAALMLALGTFFGIRSNLNTSKLIQESTGLLEPPLRYQFSEDFPSSLVACPGEVLPAFEYDVAVTRPTVANIILGWAPITPEHPDGDWGQQLRMESGDRRISVYPESPRTYHRTVADALVPDLPPGEYIRIVVADFEQSQIELYQQRVRVRVC